MSRIPAGRDPLVFTQRVRSTQGTQSNQVTISKASNTLRIQSITSSAPGLLACRSLSCQCLCTDPHPPRSDRSAYEDGGGGGERDPLYNILSLDEKSY